MSKYKKTLSALAALTALNSVQPAYADKEGVGTVIGGIIGGLIGNATGDSHNSRRNGAILGTLIGGFLGNRVGSSMDEADKRAYAEAQRRALNSRIGETIEWEGSQYGGRTGSVGNVTSTGEGYHKKTGEYCRAYKSEIRSNGEKDLSKAAACLTRNGSWYDVNNENVNWNSSDSQGGLPDADNNQLENSQPMPGGTLVSSITRKSGGEWIRIKLNQASILERMHLQIENSNLKIHQIIVVTRSGNRVPVNFAGTNSVFTMNSTKSLELIKIGVSTGYIDIRAESMNGSASMKVLLQDIHGDSVPTRAERF